MKKSYKKGKIKNNFYLFKELSAAKNFPRPESAPLIENRYNLQRSTIFESRTFRTQEYGIESMAYLAQKI